VASPIDRVLGIPNEITAALRVLPDIARNTAAIAKATRSLPQIERTMEQMSEDTKAISELNRSMSEIAKLTEILEPMDARMAAIESALPVLMAQLDELGRRMESLHHTMSPLRRIAGRFPGRSRAQEG
jgi:prefoldin subunit 5